MNEPRRQLPDDDFDTPSRSDVKRFYPIDASVILEDLDEVRKSPTWFKRISHNLTRQRYLYHTSTPPQTNVVTYPTILAPGNHIEISAAALETEIILILEMREDDGFDDVTAIYSIETASPIPFIPSDELVVLADRLNPGLASSLMTGILIHEDLYPLESDPAILHDLLGAFLRTCSSVEIKLKHATDDYWRYVVASLTNLSIGTPVITEASSSGSLDSY